MHKKAVMSLASLAVALTVASVAWACVPPGFGTPALTLSPESGPVGTAVALTADAAFAPGTQVDITIATVARTLATTAADANGHVSTTITIPEMAPGSTTVRATNQSTPSNFVTAPFAVTASAQTPPPAAGGATVTTPAPESPAAAAPEPVFGSSPSPDSSYAGALLGRDTAAPVATARLVGSARLATVLRRGLSFSVGSSEACRIDGRASLAAASARSLGLTGVIARRSASMLGAGRSTLVMRLSSAARTKLRRARAASLRVALTITDLAGNRTVVQKTVRLRR